MDIPIDSDLDLLAIEETSVEHLPETGAAWGIGSTLACASSFATAATGSSVGTLSSM